MTTVPTRRTIGDLDPERDCQAIMRWLVGSEFPFDYRRSMIDLNFLKGLAAPRIAGPIRANGYLARFPQKRYDDTALFMMEFVKHGYDSPRGRAAIARMNQVHSHFTILQEDYLYVLVGLMFEPIDWIDRFGWRTLTDTERQSFSGVAKEVRAVFEKSASKRGLDLLKSIEKSKAKYLSK